ncbi:hypothetical protein [Marinibacterium sp. SX1]|uniref:hypothetical protein n=1 Tax=Marinibacterium sp. SX1 TaxID=3388424 RepID=UPI003D1691FC
MDEFEIADLRARHPLPDGMQDSIVNRSQLALALNVSEPTVSKYLAQGLPCAEEGGNGREYAFSLADCYAWRMARDAAALARKREGDQAAAAMNSLFRNLDEDEPTAGMSAKEIAEASDAEWRWQRAAEGRRELVRVSKVRELFEGALVEIRNTMIAIPDFAEMEFGLSPEQVQKIEGRCDAVLELARARLDDMLAQPGDVVAIKGQERDQA